MMSLNERGNKQWAEELKSYWRNLSGLDRLFASLVISIFEEERYLKQYDDVRNDGINPIIHWLEHGIFEKRILHPKVAIRLNAKPDNGSNIVWEEFKWKDNSVFVKKSRIDINLFLDEFPKFNLEDERLIEDLESHAELSLYIANNPDVAESNMHPIVHWLKYGLIEGRAIGRLVFSNETLSSEEYYGSWINHIWENKIIKIRDLDCEFLKLSTDLSPFEKGDELFIWHILENFDRNFYLRTNSDIREAGINPIMHFFAHGFREERPPSPYLRVELGFPNVPDLVPAGRFYKWRGWDVHVYTQESGVIDCHSKIEGFSLSDERFASFVRKNIDNEMYLSKYDDVKHGDHDPFLHFLRHGLREGRLMAPNLVISEYFYDPIPGKTPNLVLSWMGQNYEIKRGNVDQSIIDQVIKQAAFEPAIFSAGANALSNMRIFDGPDLMDRDRVNVDEIFRAFEGFSSVIVIIPFLLAGGAEKYASDLVDVLLRELGSEITVIVTEQSAEDASWKELSILQPILKSNVVFWKDLCNSFDPVTTCSRLLNALRPKYIFVINSRLGLDVVSSYGRGLSQFSKIFCAYFSLGLKGLGVPYGVMFPRLTVPFATSLTDNEPMRQVLDSRYGPIAKTDAIVLPPKINIAFRREFIRRQQKRKLRPKNTGFPNNWVWYSRIELFKGTAVLSTLSKMRPNDQFSIYGPGGDQADYLGLNISNIRLMGSISDIQRHDFSAYDGFIFTSLFEGMPNSVLEMAQHAVPMVVTDVGGLRDTFRDTSVMFVEVTEDLDNVAAKFDECLSILASADERKVINMISDAYDDVNSRHSPSSYRSNVKRLILND